METLGEDSHSDDEVRELLKLRNVAVVGMSRAPTKPAYVVPKYLKEHGYHIVPINPFAEEIMGVKCHKSVLDVNEPVDIADIFRPSEDVPPIVEETIKKRPKVIWLQEGIHSPKAEEEAARHGLEVVWNSCMMKEDSRVYGEKPRISLNKL